MASATTPKILSAKDLTEMARNQVSISVKNTQSNIVIFTNDIGSGDNTEWAASGDVNGEDIHEVSVAYLNNTQFRRALLQGIFEIVDSDDDEVMDAIEATKLKWQNRQLDKEQATNLVQPQQQAAYTGRQCIAPEGRGRCAEFSLTAGTGSIINDKPPLCQKHQHLKGNYIPEETGTFKDGKPELRWNLITLQK